MEPTYPRVNEGFFSELDKLIEGLNRDRFVQVRITSNSNLFGSKAGKVLISFTAASVRETILSASLKNIVSSLLVILYKVPSLFHVPESAFSSAHKPLMSNINLDPKVFFNTKDIKAGK